MKYVIEKLNSCYHTLLKVLVEDWDSVVSVVCEMVANSEPGDKIDICLEDFWFPSPNFWDLWEEFSHRDASEIEDWLTSEHHFFSDMDEESDWRFECEEDGTWSFSCLEFG